MTITANLDPGHTDPEAGLGRSAMIGATIGCVAVTVVVTIAATLGGIGLLGSLGLAAFAGMWSGVGFGFMMGGMIWGARAH